MIRCQDCLEPKFENLKFNKWYRIVVPTFTLNGGDNIKTIAEKHRNHKIGNIDIEEIVKYVKNFTPIDYKLDGRLKLVT